VLKPVPMSVSLRLIGYTVVLSWLALDLLVFEGPLYQRFQKAVGGVPEGLVLTEDLTPAAVVYGRVITLRELDQRLALDRLRGGQDPDLSAMHEEELAEAREVALDRLILEHTMVVKVRAREEWPDDGAVAAAVAEAETALGGAEAVARWLDRAGMSRERWESEIASELARDRYLERLVEAPAATAASDDAVLVWFAENQDLLENVPTRVRAAHWFRAALHQDPEELESAVREMYRRLVAGEIDFATACGELSDDGGTKERRGELGWIERDSERLPDGLDDDRLFRPSAMGLQEPMQSRLGWHIFLIHEVEPPRPPRLEDYEGEIRARLLSDARSELLSQVYAGLREAAILTRYPATLRLPPTQ